MLLRNTLKNHFVGAIPVAGCNFVLYNVVLLDSINILVENIAWIKRKYYSCH